MKSLESERMELFPYPGKHPLTKLGHLPALSQQMSFSSSNTASTELFILPEKLLSRLDRKKYSPKRIFIGCANLKYSDDLEMKTWKFENYDSCAKLNGKSCTQLITCAFITKTNAQTILTFVIIVTNRIFNKHSRWRSRTESIEVHRS